MGYYNKGEETPYAKAHTALSLALSENKLGDEESAKDIASMVSVESLDEAVMGRMENVADGIEMVFQSGAVEDMLYTYAGCQPGEDRTPYKHVVDQAKRAMMDACLASGDALTYHNSYVSPQSADNKTTVFGSEDHSEQVLAIENFDNFKFDGFRVESILSAGLTVATTPFAAAFKPVVVPASQSGLDMQITIPQVYGRTQHPDSGAPWELEKHSIVKAALDHTILEANHTRIYPVAAHKNDGGTFDAHTANDPYLVAAGDVSNQTITVGTTEYQTRPIKYGTKVNLIGVSNHAGIKATGMQTEMDTLDPMVSIGVQYIKANNGSGGEAALKADITTLQGALLNIMAEGKHPDTSTSFEGSVWISHDSLTAAGATVEATFGIGALLNLAANTPYKFKLTMRIHATVDQRNKNMEVDLTRVEFGQVLAGADFGTTIDVGSTEHNALKAGVSLEGLGFMPDARRSNSNMRDLATIVDRGTTTKFRLACPMEAPISSVKPITMMGSGVTLDTLTAVKRMRNLGTAATALLDFEKRLIATQGIEDSLLAIGDTLVDSTYLPREIDVTAAVRTIHSKNGLEDLQNQIVNAIVMQANEMLVDSGYRNALKVYTGNANNFEVSLFADPIVSNLIMSAGDGRTLGNKRRFSINELDDRRFRNIVYISFSRTDVNGADPLNFGCHLSSPAMIYQATTTKGGAVSGETQMIPREAFYVTLPILGRLDIKGLEGYFHNMTNN
ncbi:major capsid protein [Vibrio phage BONAISHI]|nr:major capsid protein [Vibrio phage BONAISHI]